MKPGWKTTEFWMTVVITIVAMLAALGIVGPADRPGLEGALQQMIQSAAAFITASAALWKYITGRVEIKNEQVRAEATVLTGSTQPPSGK